MIIISPDQIKELNAIYCIMIINLFKEIEFKKLVLINFFIRYPKLLDKLSNEFEICELEKNNIASENVKFYDSWDKNTMDSVRLLISKELIQFNEEDKEILQSNKFTKSIFNEISKYDEFQKNISRVKILKNLFNKKNVNDLIQIING